MGPLLKGCTEVVYAHCFLGAPRAHPAYLVHAHVLYRQPECSQLKDNHQFLMPAFVLKIVLPSEFCLDVHTGGVISRDVYVFGAGKCVERTVWFL